MARDFALNTKAGSATLEGGGNDDTLRSGGGGGEDAFTFIDNAAFSGTAGELRWENVGGNTMV